MQGIKAPDPIAEQQFCELVSTYQTALLRMCICAYRIEHSLKMLFRKHSSRYGNHTAPTVVNAVKKPGS